MTEITPYLNFSGNCEEAFQFYQSVLGGELEISRYSEMPPDPSFEVDGNWIMHVSLPLDGGQVLMGSDRPGSMGPATTGDNVQIMINPPSTGEGKRIFDGLADGGAVLEEYQAMFWGADYGSLIDRYGVNWMVHYDTSQ